MRVAHLMAGAAAGGAELFFERLVPALHAGSDEMLPIVRRDAARAGRLQAAGLVPEQLAFGGRLDLLTRPRARRLLQRFQPEVVVSWMSRATHHTPQGSWVHVGRLGGYYNLDYYRRCDHLVGNTQGLVDWMRANDWAKDRTHVVPNFVHDFARTLPASDMPQCRPQLLAMGRLHRDKGFDVLIRAMPYLLGVDLVIAGDGPENDTLLALARSECVAERVWLCGWRQDAGALLKSADVFVCPSRREPLGNVIIEAWSAGRPVVAVSAAGPRELITDSVNGLLTPIDDPKALAHAISTVLADCGLAATLSDAGRRRYERDFAEPVVVARWRTFLRSVRP